ncbi:hypothetical protein O6H91_06G065200 [Diphasiastrum complanatum]|uniref:Uncharacterized protein n=1 Tax=Diphasiastrum complanatum TaxID=34168 RepID=A0ACC2DEY5_DIPCM|nr:hypothetical protein O6H91_06G065200 [Diphasiastrum complanatum]
MAGVGFPSPQHPTSTHNGDDDDENVKQLQECAHVYQCLQDCLIKTDRNWKACQSEVKALKVCHELKFKQLKTFDSFGKTPSS